jgi:2-hydroxychromene-2-carboxylate isomerase
MSDKQAGAGQAVNTIDWYFDFISPFSYLASECLERLPAGLELRACPVLFAGLLQHWKTRGPAEIAPMRRFTFRHIQWLADSNNIPLILPPVHPFNPLKLLRLCIALGSEPAIAQRLFRFVWAEGRSADDPQDWQDLLTELGIANDEARVTAPEVKAQLRQNTDEAIENGVFGVPSFRVDDEIFWGFDCFDFLLAYLEHPGLLGSPGMRAADGMPQGRGREL